MTVLFPEPDRPVMMNNFVFFTHYLPEDGLVTVKTE
jgi:hypothetical protein